MGLKSQEKVFFGNNHFDMQFCKFLFLIHGFRRLNYVAYGTQYKRINRLQAIQLIIKFKIPFKFPIKIQFNFLKGKTTICHSFLELALHYVLSLIIYSSFFLGEFTQSYICSWYVVYIYLLSIWNLIWPECIHYVQCQAKWIAYFNYFYIVKFILIGTVY